MSLRVDKCSVGVSGADQRGGGEAESPISQGSKVEVRAEWQGPGSLSQPAPQWLRGEGRGPLGGSS